MAWHPSPSTPPATPPPIQHLATILAPFSATPTEWSQSHMSQLVVSILLVALTTVASAILVFGYAMLGLVPTQVDAAWVQTALATTK